MHIDFASLRLWACERAQGMLTNIFQGTIWRQYWWKKNFFYPDDLERFSLKGPVPWARSRSMQCTVGVEWFFRSSWSLGIGDWGSIRISDRSFAGVKLERVQISSQKFTLLLHWIGHFFWPADLSIWKLEGTTSGDIVWKSGHCWSTMLNREKWFRAIFENCQVLNLKNLLIP
jgi:hypothetical protein